MSKTKTSGASGSQIAFLILALLFLAVPAERYLFGQWAWAREYGFPVGRIMIFIAMGAALFGAPSLRRICLRILSAPLPSAKQGEVVSAIGLNVVTGFAAVGAVVLWIWSIGGEPALARRVGEESSAAIQWANALSVNSIVTFLILGGIVAPIIEELVFRGLLYPAWASQWGWLPSALATSLLFAVIHPNMVSQFFASLIYICLLRRTGSLRASILAHSSFNILMWYPLLGQFLFPGKGRETGEISYWTLQLICLGIACVAIPIYLWMSRDERAALANVDPGIQPVRP
jgi:membrane protease YdiL (CAAX protease family)